LRTIAAIAVFATAAPAQLFPDETGSRDLFAIVMVRVVSDYLGYDIDVFNIVLTPEYATEDTWIGCVDVYKSGSVKVSIDSTSRSIRLTDDSGSTLIFQSAANNLEYGWTGTAWLHEYLEQP